MMLDKLKRRLAHYLISDWLEHRMRTLEDRIEQAYKFKDEAACIGDLKMQDFWAKHAHGVCEAHDELDQLVRFLKHG